MRDTGLSAAARAPAAGTLGVGRCTPTIPHSSLRPRVGAGALGELSMWFGLDGVEQARLQWDRNRICECPSFFKACVLRMRAFSGEAPFAPPLTRL